MHSGNQDSVNTSLHSYTHLHVHTARGSGMSQLFAEWSSSWILIARGHWVWFISCYQESLKALISTLVWKWCNSCEPNGHRVMIEDFMHSSKTLASDSLMIAESVVWVSRALIRVSKRTQLREQIKQDANAKFALDYMCCDYSVRKPLVCFNEH